MMMPIWIDPEKVKILLIGCGQVGARRLSAMLQNHSQITVIEPTPNTVIQAPKDATLRWVEEPLQESHQAHFEWADLVFIATDDPETNELAETMAKEHRKLFQRADDAHRSMFHAAAAFTSAEVQISVHAGGYPMIAKAVKKHLLNAMNSLSDEELERFELLRHQRMMDKNIKYDGEPKDTVQPEPSREIIQSEE